MPNWRWLIGAAVAVAVTAIAVIAAGALLRESDEADPSAAEAAEDLFIETATCEAKLGGHTVEVTYPAAWFSAEPRDAGCIYFGTVPIEIPDPMTERPDGISISLGAVPSPPLEGSGRNRREGVVAGHPWIRQIETTTENGVRVDYLVYYIVLDPARGEPTMVASTTTSSAGDEALNVEVLDRLIARLSFDWSDDPGQTCAEQAADYGPDFTVAGAFATTAGRIRALYPTAAEQIPEAGQPDGEAVVLCYLDGELPKGPPPDDGGEVPPTFDRAVVAVVNEISVPLVLGQDDIPVTDPTG
jgi:hypothetical protein